MIQDQSSSAQTKRLFRIYKTLLEIVHERGYFIPDARQVASIGQFQQKRPELQRQVFYKDDSLSADDKDEEGNDKKKVLGLHCNFSGTKVNDDFVTAYQRTYANLTFDSIIFVVFPDKTKSSETDKQMHIKSTQKNLKIELFKDEELLFNVLKHDLVPKHTILKQQQKADILAYYKVKESQLPKILITDPVARFLGLRKGQVVKITRKSETAGLYTTYRVAV